MKTLEEYGLKIGDKIKYIGDCENTDFHHFFDVGDILTIIEFDGSMIPRCRSQTKSEFWFSLATRLWEKV